MGAELGIFKRGFLTNLWRRESEVLIGGPIRLQVT